MDKLSIFSDYEVDFYHYMIEKGGIANKTSRDYISRLRFLANSYNLDDSITEEYVDYIIAEEEKKRLNRDKYNTKKSLVDFHSGLMKFLRFVESDYRKVLQNNEIEQVSMINNSKKIVETEKTALIQSRIGQGYFRSELIKYWQGCSITNCGFAPALIASHIKPWKASTNTERLDVFNGLLLIPNFDKLFDKGYISFDKKGKIIISSLLPQSDRMILGIDKNIQLNKVENKHQKYLQYHRDCCLL